jgi:hypothetical protein
MNNLSEQAHRLYEEQAQFDRKLQETRKAIARQSPDDDADSQD